MEDDGRKIRGDGGSRAVRDRIAQFNRRARRKFERDRKLLEKKSKRSRRQTLKVYGEGAGAGTKGSDLFRTGTRRRPSLQHSVDSARQKRLVSKSVFHKGSVTQFKANERRQVGKLDPKLVSRFHVLDERAKKKRTRRRRKKDRKSDNVVGRRTGQSWTAAITRDRGGVKSVGRWFQGFGQKLGFKSAKDARSEKTGRMIAKELRNSKAFKQRIVDTERSSRLSQEKESATDDKQADDGAVSTDGEDENVDQEKEESDADDDVVVFDVVHQSMFRQLKRRLKMRRKAVYVIVTDTETLRHRIPYDTHDIKMKSARRVHIDGPVKPDKGYGLFAPDAAHLYLEFLRRKRSLSESKISSVAMLASSSAVVSSSHRDDDEDADDHPHAILAKKTLTRLLSSRKLQLHKMTGMNQNERLDELLRRIFYDDDTDEGRTRLHFLNTTCSTSAFESETPSRMAEKVCVFMGQMETFVMKTRRDAIAQVLDEESVHDETTRTSDAGDDASSRQTPDSFFSASVRHRIRLRVEEAVYLPIRERLRTHMATTTETERDSRASSSESSGPEPSSSVSRPDVLDDGGLDGHGRVASELDLSTFRSYPPQHWGIEHDSPSQWKEPVYHLRRMANAQLPSEGLAALLSCAKAVFATFKRELSSSDDMGADDFLPVLIYALAQVGDVLDRPFLRVTEMLSLCSPDTLRSESGYYLTSMESALEYLRSFGSSSPSSS